MDLAEQIRQSEVALLSGTEWRQHAKAYVSSGEARSDMSNFFANLHDQSTDVQRNEMQQIQEVDKQRATAAVVAAEEDKIQNLKAALKRAHAADAVRQQKLKQIQTRAKRYAAAARMAGQEEKIRDLEAELTKAHAAETIQHIEIKQIRARAKRSETAAAQEDQIHHLQAELAQQQNKLKQMKARDERYTTAALVAGQERIHDLEEALTQAHAAEATAAQGEKIHHLQAELTQQQNKLKQMQTLDEQHKTADPTVGRAAIGKRGRLLHRTKSLAGAGKAKQLGTQVSRSLHTQVLGFSGANKNSPDDAAFNRMVSYARNWDPAGEELVEEEEEEDGESEEDECIPPMFIVHHRCTSDPRRDSVPKGIQATCRGDSSGFACAQWKLQQHDRTRAYDNAKRASGSVTVSVSLDACVCVLRVCPCLCSASVFLCLCVCLEVAAVSLHM